MRDNHLLAQMRSRQPSVGSWLTIPDPFVAEVMGGAGMDFLVIDTEHSAMSVTQLAGILTALTHAPSTSLVRVPANQDAFIKQALDLGAEGVIVPNVNTPEDCLAAYRSARYAPEGSRGFGPRRASRLHGDRSDYLGRANEQIAVLPMIESADAVEHIEEIIAAAPVDGFLVGPADLAVSMGLLHDLQNPEVAPAVGRVHEACAAHGVGFGVLTAAEEGARSWVERGALLTVIGSDLQYIDAGIAKSRAERERVLEARPQQDG